VINLYYTKFLCSKYKQFEKRNNGSPYVAGWQPVIVYVYVV